MRLAYGNSSSLSKDKELEQKEALYKNIHKAIIGLSLSELKEVNPDINEEKIKEDLIECIKKKLNKMSLEKKERNRYIIETFWKEHRSIYPDDTSADVDKDIVTRLDVLAHITRDVSDGKQKPLFRSVNSYGEKNKGDTYPEFARSIGAYFGKLTKYECELPIATQKLAKQMRGILGGESVDSDDLAFLPCLTVAWFISEAARNQLTPMTSLMLLDMLEGNIQLDSDNGNWYSWKNVLIHPKYCWEKVSIDPLEEVCGKVKDVYGHSIGRAGEFGGCHSMAHTASCFQAQEVPALGFLNIVHQKEGHLISHWLDLMINGPAKDMKKNVLGLLSVRAVPVKDLSKEKLQPEKQLESKKGKINKDENTIHANKLKGLDTSNREIEVKKLKEEIKGLEKELQVKESIRKEIIESLLRLRVSTLQNLLNQHVAEASSSSSPSFSAFSSIPGSSVVESKSTEKIIDSVHLSVFDQLSMEKFSSEEILHANKKSIELITYALLLNDSNVYNIRPRWTDSDGNCAFHALNITREDFIKEVDQIYNNSTHKLYAQLRSLFSDEVFVEEYVNYENWCRQVIGHLWAGEFEINLIGLIRNISIRIFRIDNNNFEQQMNLIGAPDAPREVWIAHVNTLPVVEANAHERNHYIELQRLQLGTEQAAQQNATVVSAIGELPVLPFTTGHGRQLDASPSNASAGTTIPRHGHDHDPDSNVGNGGSKPTFANQGQVASNSNPQSSSSSSSSLSGLGVTKQDRQAFSSVPPSISPLSSPDMTITKINNAIRRIDLLSLDSIKSTDDLRSRSKAVCDLVRKAAELVKENIENNNLKVVIKYVNVVAECLNNALRLSREKARLNAPSSMLDGAIAQNLKQAQKAAAKAKELALAIAASNSSAAASVHDRDHNPDPDHGPGSNGGGGGSGTLNTNAPGQQVASGSTSSTPGSPGNGNPVTNGQVPSNQELQLSNDSSEINIFNNTLWRNATLVASMAIPTEPTDRPAPPPPPPPFCGVGVKISNKIKEELYSMQPNLLNSAVRAALFLFPYKKVRASSSEKFLFPVSF